LLVFGGRYPRARPGSGAGRTDQESRSAGRRAAPSLTTVKEPVRGGGLHDSMGPSAADPDVRFEAGWIEPGDAEETAEARPTA